MEKPIAIINKYALRHNLQQIQKIAIHSKIIAIIKANAYGHGLLEIAKTIKNTVNYLGVARIKEALILRKNKITKPILLLNGFTNIDELKIISKYSIDSVIRSTEQIQILKYAKIKKAIKTWIKIDTGMHRFGIRENNRERAYIDLIKCKNIQKPINIMSHFSHSNEPKSKKITKKQLNCFKKFIKNKIGKKSIASSSSILFFPESHFDFVRPGIIIYGISPKNGKYGKNFGFIPAMTLKSHLIAIYKQKKGDPIGYGGSWINRKNTSIGIVSIGYGDGYPSHAPSGTPMIINNRKVPIIGRVSMDTTVVDLGSRNNDKIGDEVIIWGKNLPIEEISRFTKTSPYSIISNLNKRVKIQYKNV